MAVGILLAVLSGVMFGVCFTPMRYLTAFAWENTWLAWNLIACLVLSPLIAWLTIPSLFEVLGEIGLMRNQILLGAGLLSGASAILFGLGLARVGTTLANSLCNGVGLIVGSFVPLIARHPEVLEGKIGALMIGGFGLSVAGVAICSWAGSLREQPSEYMDHGDIGDDARRRNAIQGILLSIVAGLLMPLVNHVLAFGDKSMQIAREHGASETFMSFAVYLPFFAATFISTAVYCAWRWQRHGTQRQILNSHVLRLLAVAGLIAALWMAGNVLYGWALPWMQDYGPVLGWPICLVSCCISAALVECAYGDWKGR
ncbi:MAG: hypothetical protein IT427_00605, partial [Pirellulales bacterium]|nr:hypothetical protein [Pirellulales bacterium]